MDRTGPGQHDHVEIRAFSCPPHNNGSPNYAAPASVNCSAPTARQLPPLGGAQPEVFQEPWHDLRSQPRVDCLRTGSSRHWWRPSPCPKPTPHRSRSLSLDWTRIELAGGPVPARFSLLPCDPDTSRIESEKAVRSCGSGADPPSVRRWTTLKRHRQRPSRPRRRRTGTPAAAAFIAAPTTIPSPIRCVRPLLLPAGWSPARRLCPRPEGLRPTSSQSSPVHVVNSRRPRRRP